MCRSDVPRFAPCNCNKHRWSSLQLVVTLPQVLGIANHYLAADPDRALNKIEPLAV